MAFGIRKIRSGAAAAGATTKAKDGVGKPQLHAKEDPLHRDETESTMEGFFDDDDDDEGPEEEPLPIMESKARAGAAKQEDSIETALVELQHELREKSAQCDILRETLSTMSVRMKRQECQLQEKIDKVEEQLGLLAEKTIECDQWKSKYETLVSDRAEEALVTKPSSSSSSSSAAAQMHFPSILPAIDPLLGDPSLSVAYMSHSFSFTNRRPWKRSNSRLQKGGFSNTKNDNSDDNSDNEEECEERSTTELSLSEDSIEESYRSELDMVYNNNRSSSTKRSPPARRPAYHKSKKSRDMVKAFQTLPMNWLGDDDGAKKEDEQTQETASLVKVEPLLEVALVVVTTATQEEGTNGAEPEAVEDPAPSAEDPATPNVEQLAMPVQELDIPQVAAVVVEEEVEAVNVVDQVEEDVVATVVVVSISPPANGDYHVAPSSSENCIVRLLDDDDDNNKHLTLDELMQRYQPDDDEDSRDSCIDELIGSSAIVVEEESNLDDMSMVSSSTEDDDDDDDDSDDNDDDDDAVETEFHKNENGVPCVISYLQPNANSENAKTLAEKLRSRIRRTAKREARKAKFVIEKVEC